jgi:hypothetical protein
LWNAKAFERISENESSWNEKMAIKPTHSEECFGLFLKRGEIKSGRIIAFMKGDIVISPKGSNMSIPPTHYDIQPTDPCTYTATQADGQAVVHEFDCYIRGTGLREPFNGQLCNHTCLLENQNCSYIHLDPVEVSLTADGATHTLKLPLIGIVTINDIKESSECLVNYGEFMLSDKEKEGYIPCKCASCVKDSVKGRFIMI